VPPNEYLRTASDKISEGSAAGDEGTDLWHLACALYLAGNPRDLPFITLDERQEVVARKLGFPG